MIGHITVQPISLISTLVKQTNPPKMLKPVFERLSGLAIIMVMQTAEYWLAGYRSQIRGVDAPWFRRILLQPEMCPRLVVIPKVLLQYLPQMPLVQYNHMIKALPPFGSYYSLAKSI